MGLRLPQMPTCTLPMQILRSLNANDASNVNSQQRPAGAKFSLSSHRLSAQLPRTFVHLRMLLPHWPSRLSNQDEAIMAIITCRLASPFSCSHDAINAEYCIAIRDPAVSPPLQSKCGLRACNSAATACGPITGGRACAGRWREDGLDSLTSHSSFSLSDYNVHDITAAELSIRQGLR